MRIAVLMKDRCQSKKCAEECIKYCPRVRAGDETVVMGARGKPIIAEELCVGCGICIHKCPFDAIRIISLPEGVEEDLVHQFGINGFRLYRLPCPKTGSVTGLLGPNGIGKTTAINILSGELIPNIGDIDAKPSWEPILKKFAGTELVEYLKKLSDGKLRTALKPQYVDKLPKHHSGKVYELLGKLSERDDLEQIITELSLKHTLEHELSALSGGELQRLAIAATLVKDADIYFFDEPSSYLDIHQRLKVATVIRKLSETKPVVVIEHDLAILDFLSDSTNLLYGSEGAYGILSHPRNVRNAINTYLNGFLRDENVRFRDWEIKFTVRPPRTEWPGEILINFPPLKKTYPGFQLEIEAGRIHEGEVVGVVGPNSTGKTTLVQMLAGELKPTEGSVDLNIRVSYKPQYIKIDFGGTVQELFYTRLGDEYDNKFFENEIKHPLNLEPLQNNLIDTLSGGELQRVAIGLCLAENADIYLIDEPSAYLDSNQRMEAAKTVRRVMEKAGTSALIVDHDVYFLDLVSDSIMVFTGEPSVTGIAHGPYDMRTGMNKFLKDVDITFRRDAESHRPRINKPDSRLDREQKKSGEYFYTA
jgi:ATP-binding cassette subfamily E protein 1